MSKEPPKRGGIAGLVILFCATAAVMGLAFDFTGEPGGFWLGARPGGAAAVGAGAALFCFLASHIARLVLWRSEARRSGDAGADA